MKYNPLSGEKLTFYPLVLGIMPVNLYFRNLI